MFTIFIFEVDFSDTYLMTSAENSISEPPNLRIFWGRICPDLPTRLVPSVLAIMAPCCKKPSYGPESGFDLTNLFSKILTSTIYRLWSLLHCFLYQTSLGPNRPRLMHACQWSQHSAAGGKKIKKKFVLRKYDWVKFPEDKGKGTAAEGNTLDTVKFRK